MTDTITLTLDDAAAQAAFADLAKRCTDMTPLMRRIAGHLQSVADDSFEFERAPDGTPWADLSPITKALRERRGAWPGKKLQVSGALALSFATDYGPAFAEIGSNAPYARLQHKGGMAGRGRKVSVPARPIIGISAEAHAAIEDDVIAWLDLRRSIA